MKVDQFTSQIHMPERDNSRPVLFSINGLRGNMNEVTEKIAQIMEVACNFAPDETPIVVVPGAIPAVVKEVAKKHRRRPPKGKEKKDSFVDQVAADTEALYREVLANSGSGRAINVHETEVVPDMDAQIGSVHNRYGQVYWPYDISDEQVANMTTQLVARSILIAASVGGRPTQKKTNKNRILIDDALTAEILGQRIGSDVMVVVTDSEDGYFPHVKGRFVEADLVPVVNGPAEAKDPRLALKFRAAQRFVDNVDLSNRENGETRIPRAAVISDVGALSALTRDYLFQIGDEGDFFVTGVGLLRAGERVKSFKDL